MPSTWRRRLEEQPSLHDIKNWPVLDVSNLKRSHQRAYIKNRKIVAQVLSGQSLKIIASNAGISTSSVCRIMGRCLGGDELQAPALTKALIPYSHIRSSARRVPLSSLENPSGSSCSFQWLLRNVPNLKMKLDKMIKASLQDSSYAQNISPRNFHGEFKRALIESGHPKDIYPYNTQSMAYESVRRYLHRRSKVLRLEREKPNKPQFTSQEISMAKNHRALRRVQIDEQIFDLNTGIHLELNNEMIPLRLSRITLLLATDVDTGCNLGYHLALSKSPDQQDILTLFDNCVKPWKPLSLTTPGFTYEPGSCFPSSDISHPIVFNEIQMDNALSHFANSVRDALCIQQSSTISFGHPGAPTTRRWIESAFDYINRHVSHRFKSTTGSSVVDPVRESRKNSKKQPLVTLRILEEALSIVLTKHNIDRRGYLGGSSPLELFRHHQDNHYLRYRPNSNQLDWLPFIGFENKKIKLLPYRPPHINFYGVRYKSENRELYDAALVGETVRVKFDRRDIRRLNVFTEDGIEVGWLVAPHSWRRFKHSLSTRKHINSLVRSSTLHSTDPLAAHFDLLLKNRGTPKNNLEIVRVYQEFTDNGANSLTIETENILDNDFFDSGNKISEWSTSFANGIKRSKK